MRSSATQVKQFILSSKWYSTSNSLSSQLSTIVSQSALGAELLSQAFNSASAKPSLANPQEEPISVKPTDAPRIVEDEDPYTSIPDIAKVSP